MHLQQTKRASSASGGPQYYFHNLTKPTKTYLRSEGSVPVALITPYGATKSDFFAVSAQHKLDTNHKPVPGKVGHDRIQQGTAAASIGEEIRNWYSLPKGQFERIDIEIEIADDAFYLRPTSCKYATTSKTRTLSRIERPLTFTREYRSPFWLDQMKKIGRDQSDILEWSLKEISRIAKDHREGFKLPYIQETDILRASGPLGHLGLTLGGYVGKGYDCVSVFKFLKYPEYSVPIEIKKNSKGFTYQMAKYGKDELSRAIVLCANHDLPAVPPNIDIIELEAFHEFGTEKL